MESNVVRADQYLENVPYKVVEDIVHELSKDGAWLKVANNLERSSGKKIISDELRMNNNSSNGKEFFNILMNKFALRVEVLQKILENCQLYDVLRIINTNDPAEIRAPVEDSTCLVPLNRRVSLLVDVCGSPFPQIQWYFNGRKLIGKTSLVLELENFSIRDAGEYNCKIEQKLNGIVSELTSHKYILKVEDTVPRITVDLIKYIQIETHGVLALSFEVTGYPEPKCFKWYKNSKFIFETELPQLTITAADVGNSGEYLCKASSPAGHCTTRTAVVKVKRPMIGPGKPEIIEQPKAEPVYFAGDWMYLTCEVRCGEQVKFTCFVNNEELRGNSNADFITSSSKNKHKCELRYRFTKEQMDIENWKPFHFKFAVVSPYGKVLSDDVKVEVKTTDAVQTYTARNKWALVLGISRYKKVELPGSRNDIHIMKENLLQMKFRVLMLCDLKRSEILNAVKLFSKFVQKGDYVAFFYAGHGIHIDGKDYIIPLDVTYNYVSSMQNVFEGHETCISIDECISCVGIINVLQECEPALIFSIYDTCRTMEIKINGCRSHPSQITHQYASKNFFGLFATSEAYGAYETNDGDSSLLVNTLRNLMTCKISVQELSNKVLEKFDFPEDEEQQQVPKVSGDLALPLSLADPSQPQEVDESESGVLHKWERLASGRGGIQDFIPIADTTVKAIIYWNIDPSRDGVTWVISNCLQLTVILSQDTSSEVQEMNVKTKLWTGKELMEDSKKLAGRLYQPFLINHLQDLEDRLLVNMCFTYKGNLYKKEMYVESPAISQQFYKGNYVG